jgi:excisionase family DNA binding protein
MTVLHGMEPSHTPSPSSSAHRRPRLADEIVAGRLTIPVPEAAELLGIGKNACYEAIRRGEIPALRIGSRVLVPVKPLLHLINGD